MIIDRYHHHHHHYQCHHHHYQCHHHLNHHHHDKITIFTTNFKIFFIFKGFVKIFTIKIDKECCKQLSQDHRCGICHLLQSLEDLPLFQIINESLTSEHTEHTISECWDALVNLKIVNEQLCCLAKDADSVPKIKLDHFATMILLAWPYPSKQLKNDNVSHADFSAKYIDEEMKESPQVLQHEVKLLRAQLSTIFSYYESFNSPEVLSNKTNSCEATGCKKIPDK